eukprot:Hpha_TRINITY_DN20685_c0_g1::TRINITY_DN20685_c0_g1_i1::g.148065::m.148065
MSRPRGDSRRKSVSRRQSVAPYGAESVAATDVTDEDEDLKIGDRVYARSGNDAKWFRGVFLGPLACNSATVTLERKSSAESLGLHVEAVRADSFVEFLPGGLASVSVQPSAHGLEVIATSPGSRAADEGWEGCIIERVGHLQVETLAQWEEAIAAGRVGGQKFVQVRLVGHRSRRFGGLRVKEVDKGTPAASAHLDVLSEGWKGGRGLGHLEGWRVVDVRPLRRVLFSESAPGMSVILTPPERDPHASAPDGEEEKVPSARGWAQVLGRVGQECE